MGTLVIWINQALVFGSVIMLGAIGETISEKAGNMNLGTPGIMCVGAAFGMIGAHGYENSVESPNALLCIVIALSCAFLAAAIMGAIYSFFVVSLRVNQNVVGLVITIFGVGVAKFFTKLCIKTTTGNIRARFAAGVFGKKIPWLSDSLGIASDILFSYGFMFYVTIVVAVLVTLFLSKTRVGLNLRAVGENPPTADAAGINVSKYKYLATCIGAGITGCAGIYCVLDFKDGGWATADISDIESYGWLAVALVIFSMWKTVNLIWGSYLFGFFYWAYQYLPSMIGISISTDLAQTLPYIITIIVLIVISLSKRKENQGPASLGLTYFREDR